MCEVIRIPFVPQIEYVSSSISFCLSSPPRKGFSLASNHLTDRFRFTFHITILFLALSFSRFSSSSPPGQEEGEAMKKMKTRREHRERKRETGFCLPASAWLWKRCRKKNPYLSDPLKFALSLIWRRSAYDAAAGSGVRDPPAAPVPQVEDEDSAQKMKAMRERSRWKRWWKNTDKKRYRHSRWGRREKDDEDEKLRVSGGAGWSVSTNDYISRVG